MNIKHLKTKVTIELSLEEYTIYTKQVNKLDGIVSGLTEFHDLYVSDLGRLETLRWRLTDLLGLKWDRDKHSYIKEEK
jgi:hypothetical protein|tara:strand:- start:3679 stop:3912 length:234 start_codon:yes stop_codon:yes gene_type:complete